MEIGENLRCLLIWVTVCLTVVIIVFFAVYEDVSQSQLEECQENCGLLQVKNSWGSLEEPNSQRADCVMKCIDVFGLNITQNK